ncbi:MAG: peptide chain release factor N(5)-glutamine methyltransferase [Puniceicoccales bacterium]|jgi:release factor glutamine methyltransferase|nr:peptide chain release factor N(5)-glutamine methyltransferase [Puniceicoccales bacterium]
MPTLKELLRAGEQLLKDGGVDCAKIDAQLLLSHVLGCNRSALYLRASDEVLPRQLLKFFDAVHMRRRRVPLQYVIGATEFYGVRLDIDKNVLIPRHETEELVDLLVQRLKSRKINSILDLGTGSGAIAIALAKNFPTADVLAIDLCPKVLAVARKNVAKNGVGNVTFVRSNWFEQVVGTFDVIVANPPYLSFEEWDATQDEIKFFEPKLALVADNGGLNDIFKIMENAGKFLARDGILAIETGSEQHEKILKFSKKYFDTCESVKDMCKKDRFIFAQNIPV